jgi:hypothetical protein
MRNGFRPKAINLMLSALVLTWGFVPPGFAHAHSGGGDSDHRHDTRRDVTHGDAHHHNHDAHHHDSDGEHHEHASEFDFTVLEDSVLHFHWQLLGVEFSVPFRESPVEDDRPETAPPVVVRVMNEVVSPTQAGPSFDRVHLVGNCAPGTDIVRNLDPIPRSQNLATSIPLCDSARLERSGVLLA